jgi:hypothetical protein
MAVDPGGTTGIATALIDGTRPTVASAMRRARSKGLIKVDEIDGRWYDQAWQIARRYFDWLFDVHIERSLITSGHGLFVIERFDPRAMGVDYTPLEIQKGVEILLRGGFGAPGAPSLPKPPCEFDRVCSAQTPSAALGFCTDTMLRDWGLFQKSAHKNDALRHLAKRIDRLLQGERP